MTTINDLWTWSHQNWERWERVRPAAPGPYDWTINTTIRNRSTREDPPDMSTIPDTLDAYKEFARKEALKVQADMGWPDEKLNATLRALGLPEKQVYKFYVKAQAERAVIITVDDAESETAALAGLADNAAVKAAFGRHATVTSIDAKPLDQADFSEFEDPDRVFTRHENDETGWTMMCHAGLTSFNEARCSSYQHTTGYMCTRLAGHRGNHAGGHGHGGTVGAVWDIDDDYPSTAATA